MIRGFRIELGIEHFYQCTVDVVGKAENYIAFVGLSLMATNRVAILFFFRQRFCRCLDFLKNDVVAQSAIKAGCRSCRVLNHNGPSSRPLPSLCCTEIATNVVGSRARRNFRSESGISWPHRTRAESWQFYHRLILALNPKFFQRDACVFMRRLLFAYSSFAQQKSSTFFSSSYTFSRL